MPREIALLDALAPNLLPVFLLSVVVYAALDKVLAWCGVYRHVWHPPLFRFSCFVCIFGVGGLLVMR
jgi:protein-S-isoprenylcysteine O-methyltransferase Ste14